MADAVKLAGILHFAIGVGDLEIGRRFYEDVLGCTYLRQNDTTVFMRVGGQYFVLTNTAHTARPIRPGNTNSITPSSSPAAISTRPCARSRPRATPSSSTRTKATAPSPGATPMSTIPSATPSRSSTSTASATSPSPTSRAAAGAGR